jgi:hypothetical protein
MPTLIKFGDKHGDKFRCAARLHYPRTDKKALENDLARFVAAGNFPVFDPQRFAGLFMTWQAMDRKLIPPGELSPAVCTDDPHGEYEVIEVDCTVLQPIVS